ncbi:MAG: DNA polymerase III subunit delta [Clostridia bacterium]|nr:DNA polymerase III subunit delta [Clostridia bacterium]
MYNIKDDIKNSIYKNAYILCGEEEFLIDHYSKEIISANTDEDTAQFNLMKISKELPSEEDIDAFINSYPFMSERKVLLLHDTGIFKKASENQKKYWSELIQSIPEYAIIIFAETQIDKRSSLYKQVSKIYPVCEFEYQTTGTLASWLIRLFKSSGKTVTSEDAAYMAEISGPSMMSLKSEAEKLISYCTEADTITAEMIDSLVTRNIENKVFGMVDDIVALNRNDAFIKLSDLKALNEEPIKIISIIFKKFATFHKLLILKSRPMREICSLTGLYEKHAKNNLAQADKLGARKIVAVMSKCRDMDFAVKNGSIDKWLATEIIINEALSR